MGFNRYLKRGFYSDKRCENHGGPAAPAHVKLPGDLGVVVVACSGCANALLTRPPLPLIVADAVDYHIYHKDRAVCHLC